ncbi:MAG TPA: multiheme C-type cytochrome [Desulfobulbaceae bacterium]|nr:multiheme C-type cytochrome [Desulfobulbaceae bacterium]
MKIVAILAAGLLFSGLALAAPAEKAVKTAPSHPELSAQEMLVDCAECHKEATPQVEKEWYDSQHGLAMVKCYQCHGGFENFALTPPRDACAACHADQMTKCPQDKTCWQCHVPHTFAAKP